MNPDPTVAILGIGSAIPRRLPQSVAADMAIDRCCEIDGQKAWLQRVYDRAGVSNRGSIFQKFDDDPDGLRDFFVERQSLTDRGPTTAQRMQLYAEYAPPLAERACRAALDNADISSDGITHLITVSCTGFFAPGLDVAMIERLRLKPSVQRTHIGFMGCHAAMNALNIAKAIAMSNSSARVLVCCVELCTLHFAYGWRPERIVANSLFGDGAAAVVISQGSRGWKLRSTASRLLADSTAMMGWIIGDHGFEMALSPEVPAIVRSAIREWTSGWADPVDHWAIHPGGPKVITAVGEAMELSEEQLLPTRAMLRELGNMSSGTVLMILERMKVHGRCAMVGFGPGLMMEGILVER